ncbi:MAG: hypothetical protein HEP71_31330 [Roseivirga sp.]|nr:hypothetical protein [Roseivirga sp.]
MKKLWVILTLLVSVSVLAQEVEESTRLEASTQALQKANQKVQRQLDKLEKKLTRFFNKRYPQLSEAGIDSLVQADLTTSALMREKGVKDSTANYLSALKERVLADLEATPPNLPVAREVMGSAKHLQKLREMQTFLAKWDNLGQALSVGELKKLDKEASVLSAAISEYKELFEGWEEKLLSEVTSLEAVQLAKEQIDKMQAYQPLPEGYRNKTEGFQTNEFVKKKLEEKMEELKKTGTESLQSKFDQAQMKMTEAKQKFPNLESVEETPKTYNPYKGKPFFKRLKPGGDFQVNRQKPVSVDAALNLVYPLNLKASVGLAGATRVFLEKSAVQQVGEENLNFRGFARYRFWKSFFFQANYEISRMGKLSQTREQTDHRWVRNALAGVGKELRMTKGIQMNVTAFYDFFYYRQSSPNNQPWVFRMGFGFGK